MISLNVLQQGQVPVPVGLVLTGATSTAADSPLVQPLCLAPPVYRELAKAYTVRDAWREWREALAGRQLYGSLRRRRRAAGADNMARVQFC